MLGCRVGDVSSLTSTSTSSSSGADSSASATGTTSSGSGTTTGADSSAGGSESTGGLPESCLAIEAGGACAPFSPSAQAYATQQFLFEGLASEEVCPCAATGENAVQEIRVFVDGPAGWPDDPARAPVVVFHHGNGQNAEYYEFSALAAAGFVVLNVETSPGFGASAPFGLMCGLELAQSGFEVVEGTQFRDAVDCNALVAAHSLGAGAAGDILAGSDTPPYDILESILRPYALRGGMLLAPELRDQDLVGGPLPILILASAADADIDHGTDAIARYDLSAPENSLQTDETPRAMVYSWGTEHRAFGGGNVDDPDHGIAGRALVDGYLPAFAAATVFGDATSTARWWSYLTRQDYPASVLDPDVWAHTGDFTQQSPVHCEAVALSACGSTPGCEVVASACVQVDCSAVDANDCPSTPGCVLSVDDACMHLPRLRTAYTVDQAGAGTRTPVALFESQTVPALDPATMEVTVDAAADALASIDFAQDGAPTGHQTGLMLVQWGSLGDPGEIFIELPEGTDLSQYSHLSLRVGNVLDKDDDDCTAASDAAVSFELGMVHRLHQQVLTRSPFTTTGRIVQNDHDMLTLLSPTPSCEGQQTMTTVRFPLAPFCLGVGATEATHLVLRFADSETANRVLIDTIELTASPLDDDAVCGTLQAGWYCQVDELEVTQTACAGEPTPTCDPGDVTSTPLDAPLVEPAGDDAFHGWWVQTPPGAVLDPDNPTAQELALIRDRCVSAC